MFRHIVMWKLKPFADGASSADNAMKMKERLESLRGKIEGILLKDGEPMSALVPFDEYESLLETLDILEDDPDILSKLKRAEKEMKRGKCATWKGAKQGAGR